MIIRVHFLIDVLDLYKKNKDKALRVKSSRQCLSKQESGQGFNSTRLRILNDNFLAMTNTSGDMKSLYTTSDYASNFLTRRGVMRGYGNSGAIIDRQSVIDIVGEANSPINGN